MFIHGGITDDEKYLNDSYLLNLNNLSNYFRNSNKEINFQSYYFILFKTFKYSYCLFAHFNWILSLYSIYCQFNLCIKSYKLVLFHFY